MTFSIDEWVFEFTTKIKNEYRDRLIFIGLQGSYRRNEANDESDIDIVVILDELTMQDLIQYRSLISQMPFKQKACGFISGKKEIINWEKTELFQFYNDTQPIFGSIDFLLPLIDRTNISHAIKIGACNLYHACCHNFLYENNPENFSSVCKSIFFIMQAKYFLETNRYIDSKTDLAKLLLGMDQEILNICINRKNFSTMNELELNSCYDKVISWSSTLIKSF